ERKRLQEERDKLKKLLADATRSSSRHGGMPSHLSLAGVTDIEATPIASGNTGQVRLGVFCGERVAVKSSDTPAGLEELREELRVLASIPSSPFIVALQGYYEDTADAAEPSSNNNNTHNVGKRRLNLVFRYYSGGSLLARLQ